MEALIAVGLAGSVVQFTQFAAKLLYEARQIRKKGRPSSLSHLVTWSRNVVKHAEIIGGRLSASSLPLGQEDQYLLDLATDCEETGIKFLAFLETVETTAESGGHIQSLKASLRYRMSRDCMDDFASTLDRFCDTLTLGTMLALRNREGGDNEQILTHMHQIHNEITAFIAHQEALRAEAKDTDEGIQMKTRQDIRVEAKDAIESVQRKAQQDPGVEINDAIESVQIKTQQDLVEICGRIEELLDEIRNVRNDLPQGRGDEILDWLSFRQVSWRFEEIDPAYRKTYEWVLKKPRRESGWDDFAQHLTNSKVFVPYFINGKAGSGKSTLMKFIVNSERTNKLLEVWSGARRLLILKFFFWNLGTSLQKSHAGMLRAFLYQALDSYPELIPSTFPELYQRNPDLKQFTEPSYIELKTAFALLLKKAPSFLNTCIFVDGIDEFEGDHRDMSRFLRSLATPYTKIVVSSRPINACFAAFQGCPALRLQDLTASDMEFYVRGQLAAHPLVDALIRRYPLATVDLVNDIHSKAEGVFLWVALVVRLLVEGIEDGDDMKDLQAKLRSIPSGLRELYTRMLGNMSSDHQVQAAELFQMVEAWKCYSHQEELKVLTLSFAADPIDADIYHLDDSGRDSLRWRVDGFAARIRSRCCGLLELRNNMPVPRVIPVERNNTFLLGKVQGSSVTYLHRTVAEFLTSPEVWAAIQHATDSIKFNPLRNLAAGCLSMIRTAADFFDDQLEVYIGLTFLFCRVDEYTSTSMMERYIRDIDRKMSLLQLTAKKERAGDVPIGHWSLKFLPNNNYVEVDKWNKVLEHASLKGFVAAYGIHHHLGSEWTGHDALSKAANACFAMNSRIKSDLMSDDDYSKSLEVLMMGLDMMDVSLSATLWEHVIAAVNELCAYHMPDRASELLRISLNGSANPKKLLQFRPCLEYGAQTNPLFLLTEPIHGQVPLGEALLKRQLSAALREAFSELTEISTDGDMLLGGFSTRLSSTILHALKGSG